MEIANHAIVIGERQPSPEGEGSFTPFPRTAHPSPTHDHTPRANSSPSGVALRRYLPTFVRGDRADRGCGLGDHALRSTDSRGKDPCL